MVASLLTVPWEWKGTGHSARWDAKFIHDCLERTRSLAQQEASPIAYVNPYSLLVSDPQSSVRSHAEVLGLTMSHE